MHENSRQLIQTAIQTNVQDNESKQTKLHARGNDPTARYLYTTIISTIPQHTVDVHIARMQL